MTIKIFFWISRCIHNPPNKILQALLRDKAQIILKLKKILMKKK